MHTLISVICFATIVTITAGQQYELRPVFNKATDCLLVPQSGTCSSFYQMFYYDARAMTCRSFMYGGCGGNANLFRTDAECRLACAGVTTGPIAERPPTVQINPFCMQPSNTGCNQYAMGVYKFYFIPALQRCSRLLYCRFGSQAEPYGFDDEASCNARCPYGSSSGQLPNIFPPFGNNPNPYIPQVPTIQLPTIPPFPTFPTPPPVRTTTPAPFFDYYDYEETEATTRRTPTTARFTLVPITRTPPPPPPPPRPTNPPRSGLDSPSVLERYVRLSTMCLGQIYGSKGLYNIEQCALWCESFVPCQAFSFFESGRCDLKYDCNNYQNDVTPADRMTHIASYRRNFAWRRSNTSSYALAPYYEPLAAGRSSSNDVETTLRPNPYDPRILQESYQNVNYVCMSDTVERYTVTSSAHCAYLCDENRSRCGAFQVYQPNYCDLKSNCLRKSAITDRRLLGTWIRQPWANVQGLGK